MKTINELRKEALQFRELLNNCDKSNTKLVIDRFPIMSCKLSSMLLAYHFLKKWPKIELKNVSTATDEEISHYWLEIDDIIIYITGEQYTMIDDSELNKNHKSCFFPKMYCLYTEILLEKGYCLIQTYFISRCKVVYKKGKNENYIFI